MTTQRAAICLGAALVSLQFVGCHKSAPPPPPPAPAAKGSEKPVINYFTVEPASVAAGQHASLRWSVSNATTIEIDNQIGSIPPSGSRDVSPPETTSYTLKATNAAGSSEASVSVSIIAG